MIDTEGTFCQAYCPAAHAVRDIHLFGTFFLDAMYNLFAATNNKNSDSKVIVKMIDRLTTQKAEWLQMYTKNSNRIGLSLKVVLTTEYVNTTMDRYLAVGVTTTVSYKPQTL